MLFRSQSVSPQPAACTYVPPEHAVGQAFPGGEGSLKNHDGFGASYLWPPTGSHATHVSGCQVGKLRQNSPGKPQWITQHSQTNKLSDDAALAEYVYCKINVELEWLYLKFGSQGAERSAAPDATAGSQGAERSAALGASTSRNQYFTVCV